MGATPLLSNAAVVTLSYGTFQETSDFVNFTTVTPTLSNGTEVVQIPSGDTLVFNVLGEVTGNANPAATGGADGTYSSGGGVKTQPANLGLAAFGTGFTSSAPTSTTIMDASNVTVDVPPYSGVSSTGTNVAGGIGPDTISGGFVVATQSVNTTAGTAALGYGGGTPAELFNGLQVDGNATGTFTFTPMVPTGNEAYAQYVSGGTSASSKPVYQAVTAVQGVDTINNLPVLEVIVGSGSTAPTTGHSIISLTSTNPGSTYGGTLTTIALSHFAGAVVPGYDRLSNTTTATAVQPVTGFAATDVPEEFALALLVNGAAPTSAQLTQIVSDINSASSTDGVTASVLTAGGPFSNPGPFSTTRGYDVLLTSTTSDTTPFLGFDFTQETTVSGVTVAAVAAVPEPATAVGLLVGAGSLLLGRRKNRIA